MTNLVAISTCDHADLILLHMYRHTHTLYGFWDQSQRTGEAESDRTQEEARLDQSAAAQYKSHQPARQIVIQKSQILLDREQALGDANLSDYQETSWTSSSLCSHDSSETDKT